MEYIKSFNEFINEISLVNENKFEIIGNQGKFGKIDKEILDIALKAFPKIIVDNISKVEGHGSFKLNAVSPPTISSKGQSRGEIEYNVIDIHLKEPIGKNKVNAITVGLRKRTSGPGTGYLMLSILSNGSIILPEKQVATEFWTDPSEILKELYDNEIKSYMK